MSVLTVHQPIIAVSGKGQQDVSEGIVVALVGAGAGIAGAWLGGWWKVREKGTPTAPGYASYAALERRVVAVETEVSSLRNLVGRWSAWAAVMIGIANKHGELYPAPPSADDEA